MEIMPKVTLIELSTNCSSLDVKQRLGRVKRKCKEKNTKGIKTNTVIKHYLNTSERENLQGNDQYLKSVVGYMD